ncbi:MAG: amidohydrolase family protein [Acidobacteriaceae bacterium]|jgi:L-fuconolactonase
MPDFIDAHHHLWNYTPIEYDWIDDEMSALRRDFTAADFSSLGVALDLSGSVAVQARQTLEETHWLLACAAKYPTIRGVVGWVPLASEELPEILADLARNPLFKAVRHVVQEEPDPEFLLRDDFNRGIARLQPHNLAYDILIRDHQLPQTARFVEQHPNQSFVLDHLAKPRVRERLLEPWSSDLKRLAAHPNVVCKLSGLVTEADWKTWTLGDLRPYLDTALELFGPARLMAGSDWPVCLLATSYNHWWATLIEWAKPLTPSERACIFGDTATRIYRLTTRDEGPAPDPRIDLDIPSNSNRSISPLSRRKPA